MSNYKEWLTTYYCLSDKGKEILWGKIVDLQMVKDQKAAVIHCSKNPIGSKIMLIPLSQVSNWLQKGAIWRKRKR